MSKSNTHKLLRAFTAKPLRVLAAITTIALFAGFGAIPLIQDITNPRSSASAVEPADINNDNKVDIADLSLLVSEWGKTDTLADVNDDGTVNIFDLSFLISRWGAVQGSGGSCVPLTTGQGGYPLPNLIGYANNCNTGPRHECTTTQGTLITSYDGQVIDSVCINGSLEIRHNNVTVRDTLIMGTGPYSLDIGEGMETNCPTNLRVEYSEVNMANAGNIDWAVYQRCAGGHLFDHIKVHNSGRLMLIEGNITITDSFFYAYRTTAEAHRTALSTHGGDNFTVTGNTFICYEAGCSSSVNMYSDYAPVTNYLFQNNVLSGGTICLRGGDSHQYKDLAHDIRVIGNRFSTVYNPECGCTQAFGAWDPLKPGNVDSGNVWHESGLPIRANYSSHLGCGPYSN